MDLSTNWTLVACGLMAHADGVLDGEECDRLMAMVEEELDTDADAYAEWLTLVGDRAGLETKLSQLPQPPPERHREILEQAWTLALVDGKRCEAELAMLQSLAEHLGVEAVQLEFWREAWSSAQEELAEATAAAIATLLGGDLPAPQEDHGRIRDVLLQLPYPEDARDRLLSQATQSGDREAVVRPMVGWPRRKRVWLLRSLADLVVASAAGDQARERFLALGEAVGLDPDKGRTLLKAAERRRR